MKNKFLLSLFFTLTLASCSPPEVVIPKSSLLVSCVHKENSQLDFKYHEEDLLSWDVEDSDEKIYLIDTVDSGQIAMNSPELANYDCK